MRRRFQPHHVSIHAPAWGTTLRQTSGQRLDSCFNPRTRVGCDCGCWCGPTASSRFNPRTRVGCDTATTTKAAPDLDVSIHAPAWGATSPSGIRLRLLTMFQSTHPRGVRHQMSHNVQLCHLFQSTHPRGVRLTFMAKQLPPDRFQSTHPRGVRLLANREEMTCETCFNPRTRVGCDCNERIGQAVVRVFQSTHPRGVRRDVLGEVAGQHGFQSTHPRGVRPAWPCFCILTYWFQSTHPRGVRLVCSLSSSVG